MTRPTTTSLRVAVVGALSLALAGCGAGSGLVGVHDAPAQVTTTAPISADTAETIATRVLAKAAEASGRQAGRRPGAADRGAHRQRARGRQRRQPARERRSRQPPLR